MKNHHQNLSLKSKKSRLYNLDYLRGLSAFGIMIYHYLSWINGEFPSQTFMGRFGIYGVSIFYVLSGLTLYHVYYDKMLPGKNDTILFFKKRVLRIFPLLWVVTILAIILSRTAPSIKHLFLNLSGLFGFLSWDKYFSAGVWSIGNELVFYTFFPLFIFLLKSHKSLMLLLSIILFGLYLYFGYIMLNPSLILSDQWKNYVNPLNQIFLFLGGFLIGHFFSDTKLNRFIVLGLLIFSLLFFSYYPASGDPIIIVTGINRIVFTVCCFLICFCFFKLTIKFPRIIHEPMVLLGETSYSIYLLHPIVWTLTSIGSKHIYLIPPSLQIVLPVILTLILSYFIYQYFEKYFIRQV